MTLLTNLSLFPLSCSSSSCVCNQSLALCCIHADASLINRYIQTAAQIIHINDLLALSAQPGGKYNALRKKALKSISADRRRFARNKPLSTSAASACPAPSLSSQRSKDHSISVCQDLSSYLSHSFDDYQYNNNGHHHDQPPPVV